MRGAALEDEGEEVGGVPRVDLGHAVAGDRVGGPVAVGAVVEDALRAGPLEGGDGGREVVDSSGGCGAGLGDGTLGCPEGEVGGLVGSVFGQKA